MLMNTNRVAGSAQPMAMDRKCCIAETWKLAPGPWTSVTVSEEVSTKWISLQEFFDVFDLLYLCRLDTRSTRPRHYLDHPHRQRQQSEKEVQQSLFGHSHAMFFVWIYAAVRQGTMTRRREFIKSAGSNLVPKRSLKKLSMHNLKIFLTITFKNDAFRKDTLNGYSPQLSICCSIIIHSSRPDTVRLSFDRQKCADVYCIFGFLVIVSLLLPLLCLRLSRPNFFAFSFVDCGQLMKLRGTR